MESTFVTNCNLKCWECSRQDCNMTDIFICPDFIFNEIILDFQKSLAGFELTRGIPKQQVDENLKKRVVALKIAREIYLENSQS